MIFLVVTSVIKIIISLKDQSTSSFEIDEVDNNFEESTNTFRSTEAIGLFFGKLSFIQCFTIDHVFTNINILDKRPKVANWTNFDLHTCLKPKYKFKIKDAKWNANEFTTQATATLYNCYSLGVTLNEKILVYQSDFILTATFLILLSFDTSFVKISCQTFC